MIDSSNFHKLTTVRFTVVNDIISYIIFGAWQLPGHIVYESICRSARIGFVTYVCYAYLWGAGWDIVYRYDTSSL